MLQVCWVLPYCEREFNSKTLKYFSHLFGHESDSSLLGYLKDQGLAMSLSSNAEHEIRQFSQLSLDIVLTQHGYEQVHDVVAAVFKYA